MDGRPMTIPSPNPEAWLIVSSFGGAVRSGTQNLETVPGLLKRLLAEDMWRCFNAPRHGVVTYDSFAEFLNTHPPAGIGVDVEVVRNLLRNDVAATDLLDQALRQPPGTHPARDIITSRGNGTSRAGALRRLRDQQPALHTAVLAGELSPHAAMVQAGYRPRTVTVPIDDDLRLAAALRRHLNPERRRTLIAALLEQNAT